MSLTSPDVVVCSCYSSNLSLTSHVSYLDCHQTDVPVGPSGKIEGVGLMTLTQVDVSDRGPSNQTSASDHITLHCATVSKTSNHLVQLVVALKVKGQSTSWIYFICLNVTMIIK